MRRKWYCAALGWVCAAAGTTSIVQGQGMPIDYLARRDLLTHGDSPGDVFIEDFNGDGWNDVLCLEAFADVPGLGVYLGDGEGGISERRVLFPGLVPGGATTGDVNEDGITDLVATVGSIPNTLAVFLGSSSDSLFQQSSTADLQVGGWRPVIADFDEDGHVDLVLPQFGFNRFLVLIGDGNGGFTPLATVASPYPVTLAVRDFDGDGHQDVVAPARLASDEHVYVHRGRGDGFFDPPYTMAVPFVAPMVNAADLDRNGLDDLVLAGVLGGVVVFMNHGSGFDPYFVWSSGVSSVTALLTEDLNADSYPDVVVCGGEEGRVSVTWVTGIGFNDGSGGLGPFQVARSTAWPVGLDVGELNGDGIADIATSGSQTSDIALFFLRGVSLGDIARSIPTPILPEVVSHAGDLNGDGRPDVVVAGRNTTLARHEALLYAGSGSGVVEVGGFIPAPDLVRDIEIADFNQDDLLDVATAGSAVVIAFGNGAGAFSSGPMLSLPSDAEAIASGDFDEDGIRDLAITLPDTNQVRIYTGMASGGFTLSRTISGNYFAIEVVDVDGDGHLDLGLVWGTSDHRIYFGTGAGGFVGGISVPHQVSVPRSMVFADFDGDGRRDVAIAGDNTSRSLGRVSILRNLTGRSFSHVETQIVSISQVCLEAFDANGDGIVDLACGSQGSNNVRFLRGRGDGTFENPQFSFGGGAGTQSRRMAFSDFDGDERPDLLVATPGSEDLTIYFNQSLFPSPVTHCLQGSVNSGRGTVADVVFVNDSSGNPDTREIQIPAHGALRLTMSQSPSRALTRPSSSFALYAWRAAPLPETILSLPSETGSLAFSIPGFGGGRQPRKIWNNLGHRPLLGNPSCPSSAAPSTVLDRPSGVRGPFTFTLQGLIRDDGSAGSYGVSTTNGIIVQIQP